MRRIFVRFELIADGLSGLGLREFDALTDEQFELWYLICYKNNSLLILKSV